MRVFQIRHAVVTPIIFSVCLLLLSQAVLADTPVTKSENDDRSYRYLELSNHLQVLLISDPNTEKSAAALDVNVGSGEDPQTRPGLAHFLEHMLFLGTKKYPKAGEYQEYINAHSGSNNAYTSLEHTNFHFDIDPQYLDPALDRFAQFFIAPLLDESYVSRERNAVHSEYAAKIKDESRRSWDVMSTLTNPANKSARFSVGTLETLADNKTKVRDDLVKFYQTWYSSNVMTLVVLGKETPDQLEQMVRTRFAEIADKKVELSRQEVALFPDGFLPRKVYVKPLQDQRVLSLSFPIPAFEQLYREKPVAYISYMLGHEGVGSACDVLRNKKGWIESLSAGPDISNRQSADFDISLVLTQEGYRHQDEIIDILYSAIEQLKKDGVEKWRYNEQSVINDTLFRFQEKGDALDYVSTLANNLHYYAPQDVIAGMTMMVDYDEALIRRYLGYLKPENALIEVNARDVPVSKTSPYYQTQYSIGKINSDELKRWNKRVASDVVRMPASNEYVAKQLRVKKAEESKTVSSLTDSPVLLRNNPNSRLWFKQDKHFNVPRGGVYIYARSPRSVQGAEGAALTELFVRLMNDNLNSQAYSAELAGLGLAISKRSRGIGIEITGYSDKQGLLLTRVLDAFISPGFKQKDFDRIKEGLLRELENQNSQTPYQQLNRELRAAISKPDYEPAQLIPVVKKIQMRNVQEFALNWLKSLNADVLIHGNFVESDALKFSAIIENKFALQGNLHRDPQGLFVRLPESHSGLLYTVPVDHRDVAVMDYVQGVDTGAAEQARMQMLVQLMETDFYQQLRTEQQLGYIVYAGNAPIGPVPGILFVVQSPAYSAEDIDGRISDFFVNFAKTLAAMSNDDFERYRSALLKNVEEKPKNLGEEGAEYWGEIANRHLAFDLREQLVNQIKLLNQKNMADYYWKTFLSPSVRKLVVVSSTKTHPTNNKLKEKYQPIENLESFKKNQESFVLE